MSLAYCAICLKESGECKCEVCEGSCTTVVYGEHRRDWIKDYQERKNK